MRFVFLFQLAHRSAGLFSRNVRQRAQPLDTCSFAAAFASGKFEAAPSAHGLSYNRLWRVRLCFGKRVFRRNDGSRPYRDRRVGCGGRPGHGARHAVLLRSVFPLFAPPRCRGIRHHVSRGHGDQHAARLRSRRRIACVACGSAGSVGGLSCVCVSRRTAAARRR